MGVAITQINVPEVLADTTTLTSSATVTSGEPAATNSTVTDTTESAASGTEEVPTQAAASVAPVAQAATQTSVAAQTSESASTDSDTTSEPTTEAITDTDDQSQNLDLTGSTTDVTNNFKANGNASVSDTSRGDATVTLTPNKTDQSGNLTLNSQIDLNYDFDMTATVQLGEGDGISVGFHTGNSDQVGRKGGSLGFATLPGAFGWKADTYNNAGAGNEDIDPTTGYPYFGSDPDRMNQFGAFVTTDANGLTIDTDKKSAQTIDSSYTELHVYYTAATHTLTITLTKPASTDRWYETLAKTLTWSEDISNYIPADGLVSFFIAGSTGAAHSKQTFTLHSFSYHAVGTVHIKYVDQDTNAQLAYKDVRGTLNSTVVVQDQPDYLTTINNLQTQGYTLVNPNTRSTVTITNDNSKNTVTVYLQRAYSVTVNYIDDDTGTTLKTETLSGKNDETANIQQTINSYTDDGYDVQSNEFPTDFTFVPSEQDTSYEVHLTHRHQQITQSVTRTITYQGAGLATPVPVQQSATYTVDTDLVTKQVTYSTVTMASVVTPSISGYEPDIQTVDEISLKNGNQPQDITVTYTPLTQTLTVKYIDQVSGQVLDMSTMTGQTGMTIDNPALARITAYQQAGYYLISDGTNGAAQLIMIPGQLNYVVVLSHGVTPTEDGSTHVWQKSQVPTDAPHTTTADHPNGNLGVTPTEDGSTHVWQKSQVPTDAPHTTVLDNDLTGKTNTPRSEVDGKQIGTNPVAINATDTGTRKTTSQTRRTKTLPQTGNQSEHFGIFGLLAMTFGLSGLTMMDRKERKESK